MSEFSKCEVTVSSSNGDLFGDGTSSGVPVCVSWRTPAIHHSCKDKGGQRNIYQHWADWQDSPNQHLANQKQPTIATKRKGDGTTYDKARTSIFHMTPTSQNEKLRYPHSVKSRAHQVTFHETDPDKEANYKTVKEMTWYRICTNLCFCSSKSLTMFHEFSRWYPL